MKTKPPRKCSICQKPGHRSDSCPGRNRRPGLGDPPTGSPPATKPRHDAHRDLLVSSEDLPAVKAAVVGVVTALEKLPAQHRDRVLRSAQLILGGSS